jgi:hypothetical protein
MYSGVRMGPCYMVPVPNIQPLTDADYQRSERATKIALEKLANGELGRLEPTDGYYRPYVRGVHRLA